MRKDDDLLAHLPTTCVRAPCDACDEILALSILRKAAYELLENRDNDASAAESLELLQRVRRHLARLPERFEQ